MQTNCSKCGGELPGGQTFCTACGTRRDEGPAKDSSLHCTACGAPLQSSLRFCTQCGALAAVPEQSQVSAPAQQSSQWISVSQSGETGSKGYIPPPPIPSEAMQSVTSSKKRSNLVFKLAIALVAILLLGGVAIAGGVAYLGYVAKKRIAEARQAYQKDDYEGVLAAVKGKAPNGGSSAEKGGDAKSDKKDLLGGLMSAVTGNDAKPDPLPEWKPAPAELVSSPPIRIPLVVSLQIDDVGTDRTLGDFESVYKIDKLNKQALHIQAAQQYPKGQGFARFLSSSSAKDPNEANKINCSRTVLMKDLANATETDSYFCRQGRSELHAGTTAMLFSKKTFAELKEKGQSTFILHEDPLNAVFKSFKAAMSTPENDKAAEDAAAADLLKKMMNFAPGGVGADPADTPPIPCVLHKDGPDVIFPVMVNGQPTQVAAIAVTCKPEGTDREGQLLVLDDADNPLILSAGSNAGGHTQVTSIRWDQPKQNQSELAQELEKDGRAKVYDLYFDFRSDVLRSESDKVLAEIAQVMMQHPDWTLSVEGNTDNIGGDQYNLDLSQRRAAAVKNALVKEYRIPSKRLETAGFGASHPIDTNDTIEGRARNRRVELVRR
jgi:outer membrane protein OmpA-like peptidoglycan-associated protein